MSHPKSILPASDKRLLAKLLKRVIKHRDAISKHRDALREIHSDIEDVLDPVDRGVADLDAAIDAFSEQL